MFFSRVVAGLFAFGIASAMAVPAAAVEKREDITDVLAVVDTLKSSTGSILPQIDSLVNSNAATEENLTPLLTQLVAALDTSSTSFNALQGKVDANSGGSKQDVANGVAEVYTNIATSLDNAKTKNPHFHPGFWPGFGIDGALLKVLLGLELVVAGVLKLVAVLLKAVAGLLSGLGFLLTITLLGLL